MTASITAHRPAAADATTDTLEGLRTCLAAITPPVQNAVNPSLTPARPRRRRERAPLEATDFAQMMARMIRAHGRRVADADVEDLADLVALRDELEAAITFAVVESRKRHGRSWADIARGLCGHGKPDGVSRQAAQQRYGKPAR